MKQIGVTIRDDQVKLLKNHPEINTSGLLQKALDDIKEKLED